MSLAFLAVLIVAAVAPRIDGASKNDMWNTAFERYSAIHHEQNLRFEPGFANLDRYQRMKIPDLESEALRLGRENGVVYIGRTE